MHYTIGTWNGLPNYSCTHCPFETLDEAEMLTHIIERHLPKPPEQIQEQEPETPMQELPVLVVTPEQLSKIQTQTIAPQPPRRKMRKEK